MFGLDTKDKHEFKPLLAEIEDRPINPLGRSLLWIIIAIMLFGTLWLYLAKVDVVVSAKGQVIPYGEVKTLQPIQTGVIRKIVAKEGQLVKKGELLLEIDPSVTATNLKSKMKNLELLKMEIKRVKALIKDKKFTLHKGEDKEIYETQKLIYETKKREYQKQLSLINEQKKQIEQKIKSANIDSQRVQKHLANTNKKEQELLKVADIIAKKDMDDVKKESIEYEEQLKMKKHEIIELQEKLNELSQQKLLITQKYQNSLLEELTKKTKEATMLEVEIEDAKFKNAKQFVTSPVEGYVSKLLVHTLGGVVTPAEKLIKIVPKNAPLVIKATVLNKDIGFVKKGMEAKIKIDTFDFQKYGLLKAKVIRVGDDAIEDKRLGAVYEVYLKPEKNYLIVKGKKEYLSAGMSVTAEMKTGKRRVVNFFIYPLIKYLDEGMSVR